MRLAKDLKQMQDQFYQSNYTGNSSLWMQGAIDKRFKVGDQSLTLLQWVRIIIFNLIVSSST